MASIQVLPTPGLNTYLKSLKTRPLEASIEDLISLLKRRQIRGPRACAEATAKLLRKVIGSFRFTDINQLIERVRSVGRRLENAQPREIVVGNVVRRILGVIRDEAEEDRGNKDSSQGDSNPGSRSATPGVKSPRSFMDSGFGSPEHVQRPPMLTSHPSFAVPGQGTLVTSMFNLLSQPETARGSPMSSPTPSSHTSSVNLTKQALASIPNHRDLVAEVKEGIDEFIDELSVADDQIAGYALEHIHANETLLTVGPSITVQKFLLRAAAKRKFTVIHAESYPNSHRETHAMVAGPKAVKDDDAIADDLIDTESFTEPLIKAGVTVILIPDSAVFALMARVNKVVLGTQAVLANGGLVALSGARTVAKAAREHKVPVLVLSGIYTLSPVYPYDVEARIEYGDASAIIPFQDGDRIESFDVENPLFQYVEPELVELYITNLGGHAPTYLYRIVADHYRAEDINLAKQP